MNANASFIGALKQIFSSQQYYTDPSDCWVYGYDNSRQHVLPHAVIFAHSHDDIVQAVKLCYEYDMPLTARGRASGTTGGAIPSPNGIVLSLERMQNILTFDAANRMVIVEAGVLNGAVQKKAAAQGFFWAPHPTSAPYCCVGGNLACNAAGPRSLKYGTTRENTLGLTAVTGTGETLPCGVYTTKSAVGYDLTRLLIGSEGTLGIISQATLKLLPLPEAKRTLRVFYKDTLSAAQAITKIMSQPIIPCGCEFIDEQAIELVRHAIPDLPEKAQSMVMIEIDGSEATLDNEVELIKKAAAHPDLVELTVAATPSEASHLWHIRKSLSQALRQLSPNKINEDVVVPLSAIPSLLNYTQDLAKQFETKIVNFGHAGNGNIHVNILLNPFDPIEGPKAKACLNLLFDKVIALQGTLSGEHGIGAEKRDYIYKALSPSVIQLMKGIKTQFDPKGILNPGKIFPL